MFPTRLTLATLSLSLFAACGDADVDAPIRQTAIYSGVDDAHLQRTLDVLSARDVGTLLINGMAASGDSRTTCPMIATSGPTTTVTGNDCVSEGGARFAGRLVLTNVEPLFGSNPAYDPTKPSTIIAEDFTVTEGTAVDRLNGTLTLSADDGDGGRTFDAVLDATVDGIAAHSDLTYDCDATDLCTVIAGSWVDIDIVGAATVEGTFRRDEPPTGAITAIGAETLVLDVAASTDRCHRFRIDGGAARELCRAPT